jgi:hypothetical protein
VANGHVPHIERQGLTLPQSRFEQLVKLLDIIEMGAITSVLEKNQYWDGVHPEDLTEQQRLKAYGYMADCWELMFLKRGVSAEEFDAAEEARAAR